MAECLGVGFSDEKYKEIVRNLLDQYIYGNRLCPTDWREFVAIKDLKDIKVRIYLEKDVRWRNYYKFTPFER